MDLEGRNKNRDDAVLTERLDKARLLSLAVRKMQISSRHLPYVLSYALWEDVKYSCRWMTTWSHDSITWRPRREPTVLNSSVVVPELS